jgi:hypothetical protein
MVVLSVGIANVVVVFIPIRNNNDNNNSRKTKTNENNEGNISMMERRQLIYIFYAN